MIRLIKRESLLIISLVTLISLCDGPRLAAQDISLPNSPLDGQGVFVDKGCVKCHAIMGKGGKIGSDLAKVHASHSPAGIVAMMWNHASDMRRAMEVWQTIPKLNESELANLVAYLFSISYFDEPGDAVRGKAVLEKSGCQKCHQNGGSGGKIGPPLDRVKQFGSPLFLAQAMWNHGLGMSRTMERLGLKRPTFEGSEIADLLSYLQHISHAVVEHASYMIPGSPKNGEKLFEAKGCINCHKIGAKGKSVGPDLMKKEFHLGATTIAGKMWNHGYTMWKRMKERNIVLPKLEGNEMADIISYLYFLEFQQQPGSPDRGKELVEEKGCTKCHMIGGRGGAVGPALAQSQHFSNFITIASRMWNHNLDMQKRMEESNIVFPRFTEQEMMDLLAYIRFQQ
jgi:cytochrome c2